MSRALRPDDLEVNRATTPLPVLSAKRGVEITVTHGTIQGYEWAAARPKLPAEAETWMAGIADPVAAEKEWERRHEIYINNLDQSARFQYESGWALARALVCAKAARTPTLTVEQALDLGPDLAVLSRAILALSGIIAAEADEKKSDDARADAKPENELEVVAA
jgi:hypothetical protein